jgi:hypothetical protein
MNQITQDKILLAIQQVAQIKSLLYYFRDINDECLSELISVNFSNNIHIRHAQADITRLQTYLESIITEDMANANNN